MINENHIQTLWVRMAEFYGHKWESEHGDIDTNNTWLKGLEDLTPKLLADGLRRCLDNAHEWPPSLPEFRALCLHVESKEYVIYSAIHNENTHDPNVKKLRQLIGTWDLTHLPEKELYRRAVKLYPSATTAVAKQRLKFDLTRIKRDV